jgi:hypothetical protein
MTHLNPGRQRTPSPANFLDAAKMVGEEGGTWRNWVRKSSKKLLYPNVVFGCASLSPVILVTGGNKEVVVGGFMSIVIVPLWVILV